MKDYIRSLKKDIENKQLVCLYRHLLHRDEYKATIELLKQSNYQQVNVVVNCEMWTFNGK